MTYAPFSSILTVGITPAIIIIPLSSIITRFLSYAHKMVPESHQRFPNNSRTSSMPLRSLPQTTQQTHLISLCPSITNPHPHHTAENRSSSNSILQVSPNLISIGTLRQASLLQHANGISKTLDIILKLDAQSFGCCIISLGGNGSNAQVVWE